MLLEAVLAAFVATQLGYFVVNCGLLGLVVRRPANEVDERTVGRALETATRRRDRRTLRVRVDGGDAPIVGRNESATAPPVEHGPGPRCRLPAGRLPRVHVLVSVAGDQWGVLERTLSSLAAQSYPVSLLTAYVVYEPPETPAPKLDGAVGSNRPPGLEVRTTEVDRDALATERSPDEWCFSGMGVTRARAGALTCAYDTLSHAFAEDDVVTVLEAGTRLPVDAFELAVAGLAEYDVVQTKRTAGNADDGVLPLLESMASAGWSDLCYESSKGPYHLLGSAYFTDARVLADIDRWQREADADVPLGMAAYRRGYSLGIVDRYACVNCPTGLEGWVSQKRQWCRGPYRYLAARGRAGFYDTRFWTGTFLAQASALLTAVGLPAFVLVELLRAGGVAGLSLPVVLLVGFNGLVWAHCSVLAYRAARDALPFRSRWHQTGYSLVVNPFTQALYAMLWAVPIWLALSDVVRGGSRAPGPGR